MPLNIAGYNISNSAGLSFGASGTKIDAAGYNVLDPLLPAAFGSQVSGGGVKKQYPWVLDSLTLNVGTVWNTGTSFTCPVAGIYYMSWMSIVGQGVGTYGMQGYYAVIKNGANHYFSYTDTNDIWAPMHLEVLIKCAAGDTLGWAANISAGPDSSTASGGYGSNHNNATIWLVG